MCEWVCACHRESESERVESMGDGLNIILTPWNLDSATSMGTLILTKVYTLTLVLSACTP